MLFLTFVRQSGRNLLIFTVATACVLAAAGGCGQRSTESLLEAGDRWFEVGDYDAAEANFSRAARQQPGNAEAHYKLGLTQLRQRRAVEARRNLEIAHTARPRDERIVDALAEALFIAGDSNRLFSFLHEQAEKRRTVTSYLRLARYAEELDDPDSARRAIETAIVLDEGRSIEPYLQAASLAQRLGDLDEAVRRLRQALSIDVHDARVRSRLRDLGEIPGPSLALPPGR